MSKKLKPVPKGNKGLSKLPTKVRNKMGFLKEGGPVKESLKSLKKSTSDTRKKMGFQYESGKTISDAARALLEKSLAKPFKGKRYPKIMDMDAAQIQEDLGFCDYLTEGLMVN